MLIYIATPYRANSKVLFDKQIAYTKQIAKGKVIQGHDVIVPHLYYPSFLDDDKKNERELGMKSAMKLILACDCLLIGIKFGKSEGVLAEQEFAQKNNIQIMEVL